MNIPTKQDIDKMLDMLMECDFWVVSSQMLYNEFGDDPYTSIHKQEYFSQRLKDAEEAFEEVKNEFLRMIKQRYEVEEIESLNKKGEWQLDGNYLEEPLSKEAISSELSILEEHLNGDVMSHIDEAD